MAPRSTPRPETRLQSGLLAATGAMLLSAAALAGRLAFEHMQALGGVCGQAAAHCAWCPAALVLAAAGLAALARAASPGLRAQRAAAR